MSREPLSDIVVLIPGITGSVLKKRGDVVWGPTGKAIAKALVSRGGELREALSLTADPLEADTVDDVEATDLIPDLHLIPKYWKIDGYTAITKEIESSFQVTPGENFFTFPYDWRRDNRVAARLLEARCRDWLRRWRTRSEHAKLILVCHSMGGLVARYFLEVLEGWKDTRALISFGTPYRGSVNALDSLVNGVRLGPLGLLDLSALTRSFTSTYQLLPTYPCYDIGNDKLAHVCDVKDLPHVDASKAAQALAFHKEIETAVTDHLALSEYTDQRYRVHPIVGISQPTAQTAKLSGEQLEVMFEYEGRDWSGDGTVPRVSATPLEYSKAGLEMFAATKHASLQNANAVLTQLFGLISGLSLDLGRFRKPLGRIALQVGDLYRTNEPIVIKAAPNRPTSDLKATICERTTNTVVARPSLTASDEWHRGQCGPLGEGLYQVEVTGEGLEPSADAFAVVK